jgi:uncharacterized membrane protein YwaF
MLEILKFLIGFCVLILGIPLGNILANQTREELDSRQKYFIFFVWIGLIGGIIGLILRNDVLMFSFFFIAIVTSRSLLRRKNKK